MSFSLIDTGLFPDLDDPDFHYKLLQKQEFYESYQKNFVYDEKGQGCSKQSELGFEQTPVQRFLTKFMSPQTPYNSALLYHGVGVGKTCAAVSISEAFLELFPKRQVFIIAPKNIQPGFYKTIFNIENVRLGIDAGEENTHIGCTGNTYLKLAGAQFERDVKVIEARVREQIKRRYVIMGYQKFRNYIALVLKSLEGKKLSEKLLRDKKNKLLRQEFSGRMMIIDEAHNLRYSGTAEEADDIDAPGGKDEVETSNEGSKLVPYLESVLYASEGTKLVLLSGTPMYNSYKDIISLLRLLVINDKKEEITEGAIFRKDGSWVPGGEEVLGRLAQNYVSFMRGENPNQFPIRLKPEETMEVWPEMDPAGNIIDPEEDAQDITNLPIIPCRLLRTDYMEYADEKLAGGGPRLGVITITDLVQAGNCGFPTVAADNENDNAGAAAGLAFGPDGFDTVFEVKNGKYRSRIADEWMEVGQFEEYSPKFAKSISLLMQSEGVVFVYSRFVKVGALLYCLALEANGYMNSDARGNLLLDVKVDKQCALCSRKKSGHAGATHPFTQAYYALLTGSPLLSSNNERAIAMATDAANSDGKKIKVVVGSQIAAEGIDLKYLRAVHILDSWLHLNKMEQVIGRGIRYCSHAMLDQEKRNCTIYIFCNEYEDDNKESVDMYSYRVAYNKSRIIGRVSRVLKENAIDCNLNLPAILISDKRVIRAVDVLRKERTNVTISDMPFTPVCDWLKNCEYKCAKQVNKEDIKSLDDTTYDLYSQKWKEAQIKMKFREIFAEQNYWKDEDIRNAFGDIPLTILARIIREIIGNKGFSVRFEGVDGYIIYKNGYYLFQPYKYIDLEIPLALRGAMTAVRRESYYPGLFRAPRVKAEEAGEEAGEAGEAGEAEEAEDAGEAEEAEEAGEAEEARVPAQTTSPLWTAAKRWVNENNSDTFRAELQKRYKGSQRELNLIIEKVDTMMWWVNSIGDIPGALDIYKKILYDYVWDEFLTDVEQRQLLEGGDEYAVRAAEGENTVKIEGRTYYRYRNPGSPDVYYICDGKPCARSVVDYIKANEPVKAKVTKESTGEVYGFLTTKKGKFVFKSSAPPGAGKKLPKGQECENVSNSSEKIRVLEKMGQVLLATFGKSLDLVKSKFWEGEDKLSARKLCVLTNLALRWMNEKGVSGKAWFYRPIRSKLAGHIEG